MVGDFMYSEKYHLLSEKTKQALDDDVQDILQTCIKEVEIVLNQKREVLDYFAQELFKKEELEYDEIEAIFNKFGLSRQVQPTV